MKVSVDDKNSSRLMIVDPVTGIQLNDHVVEVNVVDCWITCFETKMVWDIEEEKEVEIIAKEKDQNFQGPGSRYIWKMYRKYCDFDVVERETGKVVAEARYMNVSTRI